MTDGVSGPGVLHPALHGWSLALVALEPAVVRALAPMLHRLDELLSRHGDVNATRGEMAGLAGLTTRGLPERMLVSEWLLADELPDEFLRRAATRELLYLDTAHRGDPPTGATRVVVDTGPSQAGAARLVQLAALVVLHRRAHARGGRLELGVLGEPADRWHTGELPELLRAWLAARRPDDPGPEQVLDRQDPEAATWFLLAPTLAARLSTGTVSGRRMLLACEAEWDGSGAVAVEVMLAGERVRLSLPPPAVGLRVLRGAGLRRDGSRSGGEPGSGPSAEAPAVRLGGFTGASRRLVGRGGGAGDVVVARVPVTGPAQDQRTHRFRGTVIAASATSSRLIVVHQHAGGVEVEVVGRRLGSWNRRVVPLDVLGLTPAVLATVGAAQPLPVHHAGGSLWVRLPTGWHLIDPTGDVVPHPSTVLVSPAGADAVLMAARLPTGTLWTSHGTVDGTDPHGEVRTGAGWLATPLSAGRWLVLGPSRRLELDIPPGHEVAGLVAVAGGPHLVVVSAGGLMLRLVGPGATRTLTPLSGERQRVHVHPALPLVALDREAGTIEVHDLATGERRGTFAGSLG